MALFKQIVVYHIANDWNKPAQAVLEDAMKQAQFTKCGPTEEFSAGWQAPRGEENAAMAEAIDGQLIFKLGVERKSVPAAAVKNALEERCKQIQETEGRTVGRKEKRELKEEVKLDLLPRAFSKRGAHTIWINAEERFIAVTASSHRGADLALSYVTELMEKIGYELKPRLLSTVQSPGSAMAEWLTLQEAPSGFSYDRDVVLKNEQKASIRYSQHVLDLPEIIEHIEQGKRPTQLAMTWGDKVSFVLTDALVLKNLKVVDTSPESVKDETGFDADVAIETGLLKKMIPEVVKALGGLLEPEDEQTA